MAQAPNDNHTLVRRLSVDIDHFKDSHHLPDDLESSTHSAVLFDFF